MDMGRESRREKEAVTVESVFAPVTAAVLAGVICCRPDSRPGP
ncbi:DUF6332 family protein [Streptomyces phaeoluteigriseus]